MEYTIQNGILSVSAETDGAQLTSIRGRDGTEYLWQGDPAYWTGRAPNLFPYIGRLCGGTYTYRGGRYALPIHGLAPHLPFAPAEQGAEEMAFTLRSDAATLAQYPFQFRFEVRYRLRGAVLDMIYTVENLGGETMFFALGAHPGFRIPLSPGHAFEEYSVCFPEPCRPRRIPFSDRGLALPPIPYGLEGGSRIPLRHGLFDQDAVVLEGTPKSVTLKCGGDAHGVTVSFPGIKYVGFWHQAGKGAPYVCVEPWSSLPSREGVTEDLETQPDLLSLPAGRTYVNTVTIEAH